MKVKEGGNIDSNNQEEICRKEKQKRKSKGEKQCAKKEKKK